MGKAVCIKNSFRFSDTEKADQPPEKPENWNNQDGVIGESLHNPTQQRYGRAARAPAARPNACRGFTKLLRSVTQLVL